MKILIVDDEYAIRDSLEGYLETEGHECQTAKNGIDALHKLKNYSPDVMIVDFNMPEMSGLDLVKNIESKIINHGLSTLMISGNIKDSEVKSSLQHGVKKIIKKPIRVGELNRALSSIPR